jgi:acetyl-CoA carboxylase biotin carboxyl carrier protein
MNLSEIKALIAVMADSGLAEMTFSENGWTLRLVRDAAAPVAKPQQQDAEPVAPTAPILDSPTLTSGEIEAPLSGIVHLRPTPEAPPFLEVGQAIRAGDTVCIIEAMKVFNAIRADRDGIVSAILVSSGVEVDAGQPLLRFA